MTENIVKRWLRFDNFVKLFTNKLSKPAQRHFIALVIGFIVYDGRKNIAGMNRALFSPCHPSNLSHFIGEVAWDEREFDQIRLGELNRHLRRFLQSHSAKGQKVPAFLCIDDTNNPKSGSNFRIALASGRGGFKGNGSGYYPIGLRRGIWSFATGD